VAIKGARAAIGDGWVQDAAAAGLRDWVDGTLVW
jgi:hypothetical protein